MSSEYRFEAMEPQYNLRALRPDYDSKVIPSWQSRSEAYRAQADARLDLAYGPGERERVDVFPAVGGDSPLLVYFHGGYWQRGDKSLYSFLAQPFVERGISVALVNYDLCPSVRISDITPQARRATAWLWRNAAALGVSPDKLFVMGHSAGGHITGMLMATVWSMLGDDLPADMIKGGIPVSGLFDLEPLRFSSINDAMRMDVQEAAAQSPMQHPPVTNAPQLVVCGQAETAEFHRQSDGYVRAFATGQHPMRRYTVPDSDHFDELDVLADPGSEFFRNVVQFIQNAVKETK